MSSGADGKIRKSALFALKLGIAAALVWWVIAGNSADLQKIFRDFDYLFLLPALGGYFIHILVSAWRWYVLSRALNFALSPWQAISLTFQGYFFSLFMPAGAIGGDFARIAFLAHSSEQGTRRNGAVTVLVDRMAGMASLFTLAIVFIILGSGKLMSLPLEGFPWLQNVRVPAIFLLLFICVSGNGAIALLFWHRKLRKFRVADFLFRAGNKVTGGILDRLTAALDVYSSNRRILLTTFLASVFGIHLMLAAGVWLMTFGIKGAEIPPLEAVNAVTIGNIAGLLPSFSGIGFRDVTMEILLSGCCPQAVAAAVPLCFTVILLMGNLSGGIFFVIDALLHRGNNKK